MWPAVLVASAGCYLLKVAGLSVPERWLADRRVQRVAGLLPVALLAALIGLQTITSGRAVVVDARLAGVAVAVVAQWRRAPFLVVVVAACATTAVLRALWG
ncbi:MAG TPA: AzlD domain-containing protein [Acidimicrobiales bacterium]|nr:AzlD domain-containing protein [Acidimicrobiales bacterium]